MALNTRHNSRRAAAPVGARAAALEALCQIERGVAPADALAPHTASLDGRDQGFAHLLVLTTLRRRGQIDSLLKTCLAHPLPRAAARIRDLLRLGVAQILFLETPAHAAVDTAVDLATAEPGRFAPLVNAVLRRVVRERAALTVFANDPVANVPRWLWQSWVAAYGETTARAIAIAHANEPPLDLSLKDEASRDVWLAELNAEAMPGGSLRLRNAGRIDALPGFADGAWWVQDMAAALPARLLLDGLAQQGRGEHAAVVDLCAAPGGKTAQLAAAGHSVTAVDIASDRLTTVRENLERLKLSAACVAADGRQWKPAAAVDGVLLDAPCSATGTIRRHPDIAWTKSAAQLPSLCDLQASLLDAAADYVAPGGVLVYAVCSLQPEEGEQQAGAFLQRMGGRFQRMPASAAVVGGLPCIDPRGDLRTLPCDLAEQGGMDGFFAARFVRS